MLEEVAPVLHV
jgi:hypothetical protein